MNLQRSISLGLYHMRQNSALGRLATTPLFTAYYHYTRALNKKPAQDRHPVILASHARKFLFIGIPKVCTQSFLRRFFFDSKIRRDLQIEWVEDRQDTIGTALSRYGDYYKFSFVRNPWARALSCYNSKINQPTMDKKARILALYKGLHERMSFEDFCVWLNTAEGSDEIADRHWLSQHYFLYDSEGRQICDFVGRLENLSRDFVNLAQKLDLPFERLGNTGRITHGANYREFYTEGSKALIENRYARDIDLFGYEY